MKADHRIHPTGRTQTLLRSLRGKLLLSHLAVILVAMFAASILLISLARAYFLDALEESLLVQAELVARNLIPDANLPQETDQLTPMFNTMQQQTTDNLALQLGSKTEGPGELPSAAQQSNLAYLSAVTVELGTVLDAQIRVLDQRGIVLIDSSGLLEGMSLADNEAIATALSGELQRSIDYVDGEEWLFVAVPVWVEDEIVAVIDLGQPLRDVLAVLNDLRMRLALAALLALPAAALVGLYLARNLSEPIQALTHAAQDLSHGDYAAPLPPPSQDELGILNRTFDNMRRRLQREEQMRTQFVSDVSHELRTPLTALKGLVETLRDGAVDDPQVRDRFLASVEDETDRLIRLTNDLLTLSRADTQALVLHKERVDLHSLLQKALLTLQPQIDDKAVRIDPTFEEGFAVLPADPDRVEQVLLNLLDNALKHTPPHGQIRILAERRTLGDSDSITPAPPQPLGPGDWVLLTIRDNGEGIPEADMPHVFERFYRADPARARDKGGSGLGLPISKALVEAHGGQIWIMSPASSPTPPGESPGAAVYVVLPAQ